MEEQSKTIEGLLREKWEYEPIGEDFKQFECPICLEILDNPVSHSLCGNMFCRKCVMQLEKCPLCRKPLIQSDLVPVPNQIKNAIGKLKVKCKKCNQEITNEASKTHKQYCEFACPFGCGTQITIATLKEHAPLNCSKCVNKCPAFEFGCSWIGHGGSEYQNHRKECEFAKLAPLYKMFGTITARLNELDNKMSQMDNKITQIDNKMCQITQFSEEQRKEEKRKRIADKSRGYLYDSQTQKLTVFKMGNWTYKDRDKRPWYSLINEIRSIVIDESVISIGEYAFSDCSNLTSITLPDSLTSIGEGAFYCCSNLPSITLPDSLTSIDKYVFSDCSSLTSINLPSFISSIVKMKRDR